MKFCGLWAGVVARRKLCAQMVFVIKILVVFILLLTLSSIRSVFLMVPAGVKMMFLTENYGSLLLTRIITRTSV
jgi:hypothetical protein